MRLRMFFQPPYRLLNFELAAARFDGDIVENRGVKQTFDVIDGLFVKRPPQFVCEAPAVYREYFYEVDFFVWIQAFEFYIEKRMEDGLD